MGFFDFYFDGKNKLIKNNTELVRAVAIPGLIEYMFPRINPTHNENIEIPMLIPTNPLNEVAIFFAATAGTISNELIRSTPTKLIPTAIVPAINKSSKISIWVREIFEATARSGAIEVSVRGFKRRSVMRMIAVAIRA